MAMNIEFEELVEQYLTDGVITPKERKVLLKKAVKLGIDEDEADLYIDASVQKMEQEIDNAVRKQKGRTCPFCGAPIPQLTDKCPRCGELVTVEASEELQTLIEKLEKALQYYKSWKDSSKKAEIERYTREAKLYYANNPKMKLLLEEIQSEVAAEENRIQMIKDAFAKKMKIIIIISSIIAIALIVVAIFGYIDYRFNGHKNSIGLVVCPLICVGWCIMAPIIYKDRNEPSFR